MVWVQHHNALAVQVSDPVLQHMLSSSQRICSCCFQAQLKRQVAPPV